MEKQLTGEYSQTEEFAVSHALLAEKHACLRIDLLYSRLGLKHTENKEKWIIF